jgi:hypothetical protein
MSALRCAKRLSDARLADPPHSLAARRAAFCMPTLAVKPSLRATFSTAKMAVAPRTFATRATLGGVGLAAAAIGGAHLETGDEADEECDVHRQTWPALSDDIADACDEQRHLVGGRRTALRSALAALAARADKAGDDEDRRKDVVAEAGQYVALEAATATATALVHAPSESMGYAAKAFMQQQGVEQVLDVVDADHLSSAGLRAFVDELRQSMSKRLV